jgi:hypothetical protein
MRAVPRRAALAAVLLALAGPAAAEDRFALQLFHFNVQYVAGGTIGFSDPSVDRDPDTLEDLILTESLEPVVALFERHPSWGVDIELQAYALDVMAARHPALLDRLRALAKAGRADVVSFHYGDQLFLAYPEEDWRRSQALTAATFARHDVPLSKSVFCQEGQAGPRLGARLPELGYRTLVWPKNLWSYLHGESAALPLYALGGARLVQGGKDLDFSEGATEISVRWTFLDDGELLATGGINPYFPEAFVHKPDEVAAYEAELAELERQGYRITTVAAYVAAVEAKLAPAPAPPLADGTWQPKSTTGVLRWLGGGGLFAADERDNHVRTLGAVAHRELVAAEAAAEAADLDARDRLDAAWRLLALGQVSDASGINPFRGEILYGIAHFTEVLRLAREVVAEAKAARGLARALVDPGAGTLTAASAAFVADPAGAPASAPLSVTVEAGDRAVTLRWERLAAAHHRLLVDIGPGDTTTVRASFPGELEDELAVSAALDDGAPDVLVRSAFTFESHHLALPTGFIGLGGGRFLVKDMAHVHLAAEVRRDAGDIVVLDETAPAGEPTRWIFHLLEGTGTDAAALARELNVARRLVR